MGNWKNLLYAVLALLPLLMGGCKSTEAPQVSPHVQLEKAPVKALPAVAEAARPVLGVQLGGGRQGVVPALKNIVTTLAGQAGVAGMTDGSGVLASFDAPKAITTDGVALYVADSNNHTIRKIDLASGQVSTLAGMPGKKGSQDGKGWLARFNRPFGITTDGVNLYVTDSNNHTIRQVEIASGTVTTIAGAAGAVGYRDGGGRNARFFIPEGITTDGTSLYVSDTHNHSIRKISLNKHVVSTLAGLSGAPGFFDDVAGKARFSYPKGIATDGHVLYVADFGNQKIRKIVLKTGAVSTLSGKTAGDVAQAEPVQFNYPSGITTDGRNLYVADTDNRCIRKVIIASGVVSTLAGAEEQQGYADGTGAEARFSAPIGIVSDGSALYVTDSSDFVVRKIR